MKIIKQYAYKSSHQIWRILISDSDKLILETRDKTSREVFFHCMDAESGRIIFSNLQLDEKYWLGIGAIYKDVIFFHKILKPDLPGNKEIIAFDISSQKVLWTNTELSFLFILAGKVFCYQQGFEDRFFYTLDYLTGNRLEDLRNDYLTVNSLRNQSENEKDYSHYLFPKIFVNESESSEINDAIKRCTRNLDIVGDVEYNAIENLLLFNYHSKISGEYLVNRFTSFDLSSGKIILAEILNANTKSLFTDSFFVYKNLLFLLREKNEVIICKLKQD